MGRKKKSAPKFEAWCWYCDREFEDEKVLLQHQRAKHYRCPYCPRRLNTSGGLTVHLHQVHKAEPTTIENALPGRDSFSIELYGMVGIPQADLEEWQARKEKRGQGDLALGGGSAGGGPKRPKIDKSVIPIDQLRAQLEAHKALMSGKAPPPGMFGFGGPMFGFPPPPVNVPPPGYGGPPPSNGVFQRPPPPGVAPPGMATSSYGGPPPPSMMGPYGVPPSGPYLTAAAGSARNGAMPIAVMPTFNPHEQAVKQGAKTRLVYADSAISPEEKLATTNKYRFVDSEDPSPVPLSVRSSQLVLQSRDAQQQPIAYPPPNYSIPPPGFAPFAGGEGPSPPSPSPISALTGQAQAQAYPAMHVQSPPAASDPHRNTAEALATTNAQVSMPAEQVKRQADMDYMFAAKHDAARDDRESSAEPIGATELAVSDDSAAQTSSGRSGRRRAADLF